MRRLNPARTRRYLERHTDTPAGIIRMPGRLTPEQAEQIKRRAFVLDASVPVMRRLLGRGDSKRGGYSGGGSAADARPPAVRKRKP